MILSFLFQRLVAVELGDLDVDLDHQKKIFSPLFFLYTLYSLLYCLFVLFSFDSPFISIQNNIHFYGSVIIVNKVIENLVLIVRKSFFFKKNSLIKWLNFGRERVKIALSIWQSFFFQDLKALLILD